MQTCLLNTVSNLEEDKLQRGVFIVMLHATRIPPHIGIIADGFYHSLSIKGRDIRVPVSAVIKNCTLRKLPSLFIEIKLSSLQNAAELSEKFIEQVEKFGRVDIGKATCLSPIKLFFEENWNINTKGIEYIYELLPLLEQKNLIGNNYGLFMKEHLEENNFRLLYYTMKEIEKGIELFRSEFKIG